MHLSFTYLMWLACTWQVSNPVTAAAFIHYQVEPNQTKLTTSLIKTNNFLLYPPILPDVASQISCDQRPEVLSWQCL